jgi:hypothetical protein
MRPAKLLRHMGRLDSTTLDRVKAGLRFVFDLGD